MTRSDNSRRTFLKQVSALGVTGAATPLALNLAAMSAAAAQTAGDYKALVCVFLYGGNDPYNTIVPYDAANYKRYAAARQDVALARNPLRETLLAPRQPLAGGGQFALAPTLSPLMPWFQQDKLAVLLNIGPLVVPTTRAQYDAASVPLPPKLFSHNDQQSYWQALAPEGASTGWAGRMGDLFAASNARSAFCNVTTGGSALLLAGTQTFGYRVGLQGSTQIELLNLDLYGSAACTNLLHALITESRDNLLEQQHARIVRRSIDADAMLKPALAGAEVNGTFDTPLARQLHVVARMITAREKLGIKRQIFFVAQDGYDNHKGLTDTHPALLSELASSLSAFQHTIERLGVADTVTTFTASEFGRTLNSNGNGSDHGWGAHHFILGAAVRGARFYGEHPEIAIDGPGFVDHGRMLPTTSVEQLGATLATWFGVDAPDRRLVFPNLAAFSDRSLDFI